MFKSQLSHRSFRWFFNVRGDTPNSDNPVGDP